MCGVMSLDICDQKYTRISKLCNVQETLVNVRSLSIKLLESIDKGCNGSPSYSCAKIDCSVRKSMQQSQSTTTVNESNYQQISHQLSTL